MPIRSVSSALLIAASLSIAAAHADSPAKVQSEVDFLLGSIAASGCDFYRNGNWYGPQQAQVHLRGKYDYLTQRNLVDSAEQFIERAASESSISGKPYQVRCAGGAAVNSRQWLTQKLQELRASPRSAPGSIAPR